MKDFLIEEQKFYDEHKKEYQDKYFGKVVVISGASLKGVFDNNEEAFDYTVKNNLQPGKFMARPIMEDEPLQIAPVVL